MQSRGVVVLAGVNLVDVEYQVEPAGFMSKEIHRLIYTYEDGKHQLMRYQTGAAMKGSKAEYANTALKVALAERVWGELDYLLASVKAEYVKGFDAIIAEMRTTFEQQHGAGTADGSVEFTNEVNARYQAEAEKNGCTLAVSAKRCLELFEPMLAVYDRTPVLRETMNNLRAVAAGQTE
jgi:hypothetical protein